MPRPLPLLDRRENLLGLASLMLGRGGGLGLGLGLGSGIFWPLPARAATAGFDLLALTTLIAQRKSAEARFSEERFVSGFEGPLRASGTLSFSAPDRFSRQTLEPQVESMSVEGNSVTFKRGKRSRQMALDAVPELTALVEAMRGTLNGNAVTLQKHFNTQVEGNATLWILTLTPRDGRLSTQVRELKIAGVGGDLRSVELWLAGGDRSLMSITPVASSAAPSASANGK
jgi:outer membrane lipoprotein-sorting protein